ncbi:hypothetical protein [Liquorilactobacillus nagelii]|jgi:hypothetical protein|uniref:hypothetical protein n=1 Tax=Liquorilactobacillus nagelii TaxID=82688 RepID=UPI0039ECFF49
MFNSDLRKAAERNLKEAVGKYNENAKVSQEKLENLYAERNELKVRLDFAYNYINELKNKPVKFDLKVQDIKINISKFENIVVAAKQQYKKDVDAAGGTAAAGVAAGVGVAALAPTAAMALATAVGTASTGTAIASLSGAAATNAALAWLGGGALAAGGAGIGGGEALLALAGPVGWAIGGAALVGGGLLANGKNKKAAEKMYHDAALVEAEINVQNAIKFEVERVIEITNSDSRDIKLRLDRAKLYSRNYRELSLEQKEELITLVNNVLAASKHLNWVLGKDHKFA